MDKDRELTTLKSMNRMLIINNRGLELLIGERLKNYRANIVEDKEHG